MSQCFWTTSIFCSNPNPNRIVKSLFLYSVWCFWPFSLAVQFHALFLVFITIFHKIPPILGVQYWGYISCPRPFFILAFSASPAVAGVGSCLQIRFRHAAQRGGRVPAARQKRHRRIFQPASRLFQLLQQRLGRTVDLNTPFIAVL